MGLDQMASLYYWPDCIRSSPKIHLLTVHRNGVFFAELELQCYKLKPVGNCIWKFFLTKFMIRYLFEEADLGTPCATTNESLATIEQRSVRKSIFRQEARGTEPNDDQSEEESTLRYYTGCEFSPTNNGEIKVKNLSPLLYKRYKSIQKFYQLV